MKIGLCGKTVHSLLSRKRKYISVKESEKEFQKSGIIFWGKVGLTFWDKFSSVQLLSLVRLFASPWIAAHEASLSITSSRSLLTLMSIELVMPSSHLILCHPLLLLPSIFHSIRFFSNESVLHIRWPKYWSSSFSISPKNILMHSHVISVYSAS